MYQQGRADNLTICYRKKQNWCQFFMRLSCYWQWISSQHCQISLWIHSPITSWIHSYFDNVVTKFVINYRTVTWKTNVNLLNLVLELTDAQVLQVWFHCTQIYKHCTVNLKAFWSYFVWRDQKSAVLSSRTRRLPCQPSNVSFSFSPDGQGPRQIRIVKSTTSYVLCALRHSLSTKLSEWSTLKRRLKSRHCLRLSSNKPIKCICSVSKWKYSDFLRLKFSKQSWA